MVYKVITKVLVNRLKTCISKQVNPLRVSFIPGHQAANNIVIAQEMINSIRKSKSKTGGMMFKLDLKKAYDWVIWFFLLDMLICLDF